MNLLYFANHFPSSADTRRGNSVFYQCQSLAKQGHDIRIILAEPWTPPGLVHFRTHNVTSAANYEYQGFSVQVVQFFALPRNILWSYRGLSFYFAAKDLVHRLHAQFPFDVIHSQDPMLADAAWQIGQELGIPTVLTIRGLNPAFDSNEMRRNALRRVFDRSDRVFIVGENIRSWTEKYTSQAAKIVYIPNGIDPNWRCAQAPDMLLAHKNGKCVILSVSNLKETKGIQDNLEALAQLPEKTLQKIQYWIVGEGPYGETLAKLVGTLGLQNQVTFWGRVDYAEVNGFFAACDIFSLPSWVEAYGLVYPEAMLHSKPAIGCKGAGAEETIIQGSTGYLVTPRNTNELSEKLTLLIEDDAFRHTMGAQAYQHVLENHTWAKSAERLVQEYSKVSMILGAS